MEYLTLWYSPVSLRRDFVKQASPMLYIFTGGAEIVFPLEDNNLVCLNIHAALINLPCHITLQTPTITFLQKRKKNSFKNDSPLRLRKKPMSLSLQPNDMTPSTSNFILGDEKILDPVESDTDIESQVVEPKNNSRRVSKLSSFPRGF